MTASRRLTPTVVAFASLLGLTAAGCGIASHETARPIEDQRFEELVLSSTVASRTSAAEVGSKFELHLYMVSEQDTLVRLDRPFDRSPTPQIYLDALEAGLTKSEWEENPGWRTVLPDGLMPVAGPLEEQGSQTVRLSTNVLRSLNEDVERRRLMISQIVCSLTEFAAVDRVGLLNTEGDPVLASNELGEAIASGGVSRLEVGGCNATPPPADEETSPIPSTTSGTSVRFD